MAQADKIEIKIPVTELQLGMHVVRLDRSWLDTDFPVQGFVIRHTADIQALQEQCRYVYVEGEEVPEGPARFGAGVWRRPGANRRRRQVPQLKKISVESELPSAIEAHRQARELARNILEGVRVGRAIDVNHARTVVRTCVDSVLRNHEALQLLAQIRGKDEYTAEEGMNVCILSALFGRHLGLLEGELEKLALSGLLHDVGKVRVPDEILKKPDTLADSEFDIVKYHADHGRTILMGISGLDPIVVDVAYSHHERMSGNSYPRGLLAHQIPFFAKIISIVDAYVAMTSDRVYANAKSSKEALEIVYQARGDQFDESLALDFIQCIGVFPPGALVELNSGEIGIVITAYELNRLRPRVLIVRDPDGRPARERVVDLRRGDEHRSGQPYRIRREMPTGSHGIHLSEYLDQGLKLRNEDPDPELAALVKALAGEALEEDDNPSP